MIDRKRQIYLMALMVALVGLAGSGYLFLSAKSVDDNPLVYQFENSKIYRHNLELVGGKMNVVMDNFLSWFNGLWHGKSLALTVAVIAVFISGVLLIVAYNLP